MAEIMSTPRRHSVTVPAAPPHQQRPRLVQTRAVHQDAHQKAACFSAILSRFCTQLDALQSWLQCSEDGRNLAAGDARAKVEALESVETTLDKLRAALLGAGAPNRAAQLLRQADREQALQDARETDERSTCSPQVLLLLHNLASSAARTSSLLAQALRTPSGAQLERLDDNVEELVLRAKKDLILAAGWGAARPQPCTQTEAMGRTRSRLHMMLQESADDSMRGDSDRSSARTASTEGHVQSGGGAWLHTFARYCPCNQHFFPSGPYAGTPTPSTPHRSSTSQQAAAHPAAAVLRMTPLPKPPQPRRRPSLEPASPQRSVQQLQSTPCGEASGGADGGMPPQGRSQLSSMSSPVSPGRLQRRLSFSRRELAPALGTPSPS